jgi:hypothetical protein
MSSGRSAITPGAGLAQLLRQCQHASGDPKGRNQCLGYARIHLDQAMHGLKGPYPHASIFNIEYAHLQIGNAVALVFGRTVENKAQAGNTHVLAAQIVAAYCEQQHAELPPSARLAAVLVQRRNNYMYRHQSLSDEEAKRFGRAVGELYRALQAEIMSLPTTSVR